MRVLRDSSSDCYDNNERWRGATSAIPALCYTLFLYLFAKKNLLCLLSESWNTVTSRTLLVSIPLILALNAISGFLGIRYTPVLLSNGSITLGVGFLNNAALTPWTFLSNTSLAVITAYQAIHFCLAFLHFFQRAYRGGMRDDGILSMRGTGWLAAGIKLGAIETVVGFAGYAFMPSLVRRILRTSGRTLMLIGVCLSHEAGRDTDGFTVFGNDEPKRRTSPKTKGRDLRALIGKPLTETFRRASTQIQTPFEKGGAAEAARGGIRRYSQRVTVHFDAQKTPRLEMRFSDFSMPTPEIPQRIASATSSDLATYTGYAPPVPRIAAPPVARRRGNTVTTMATMTSGESTYEIVRKLAPQFPQTPTTTSPHQRLATVGEAPTPLTGSDLGSAELQRKLSRRKPAPLPSPTAMASYPYQPPVSRLRVRTDSTVLVPPERADSFVLVSPYLQDDGTVDYEPPTPTSGRSRGSSNSTSSLFTVPPGVSDSTGSRSTPMDTPRTYNTPTLSERRAALGKIAMRAVAIDETTPQDFVDFSPSTPTPTIILSKPGYSNPMPSSKYKSGFKVVMEEEPDRSQSHPPPIKTLAGGRKRSMPEVPMSVSYESSDGVAIPWLKQDPSVDDLISPIQVPPPIAQLPTRAQAQIRVKNVRGATKPSVQHHHTAQKASLSAEAALSPFADPPLVSSPDEEDYGSVAHDHMRIDSVDSGVLSAVDRAHVRASLIRVRSRETSAV